MVNQRTTKQHIPYKVSKALIFFVLVFSKFKPLDFWDLKTDSIEPNLWLYSRRALLGSILDRINQGSSLNLFLAMDKLHLNPKVPISKFS